MSVCDQQGNWGSFVYVNFMGGHGWEKKGLLFLYPDIRKCIRIPVSQNNRS